MTKCDRCEQEVGDLFCAFCRSKIKGESPRIETGDLIPLLFYDQKENWYVFYCMVKECPCNQKGFCATRHKTLPTELLHDFDKDNIIHQICG